MSQGMRVALTAYKHLEEIFPLPRNAIGLDHKTVLGSLAASIVQECHRLLKSNVTAPFRPELLIINKRHTLAYIVEILRAFNDRF